MESCFATYSSMDYTFILCITECFICIGEEAYSAMSDRRFCKYLSVHLTDGVAQVTYWHLVFTTQLSEGWWGVPIIIKEFMVSLHSPL